MGITACSVHSVHFEVVVVLKNALEKHVLSIDNTWYSIPYSGRSAERIVPSLVESVPGASNDTVTTTWRQWYRRSRTWTLTGSRTSVDNIYVRYASRSKTWILSFGWTQSWHVSLHMKRSRYDDIKKRRAGIPRDIFQSLNRFCTGTTNPHARQRTIPNITSESTAWTVTTRKSVSCTMRMLETRVLLRSRRKRKAAGVSQMR